MKQSSKKESLMNSAEELFYEHGFHAVGVKSILDRAGVAPMTMYYHFKSKEELIKAILIRREEQYFQLIEEKIIRNDGIEVYIESLFKAHIDWIEKKGSNGCLFLRAKQEYEGFNEEISALTTEHKQAFLTKIEGDLENLKAHVLLGTQIVIIMEGLTAMVQTTNLNQVKDAAYVLIKHLHDSK